MIIGLDSAVPPSASQAQTAASAGIGLWSGYLATRPGSGAFNLDRPWTPAEFDNARLTGGTPIAFCSGWDDPAGLKFLASQLNLRLCLDVEGAIRGDGPWVQPWVDEAGCGLYGNLAVHSNRRAAFHVLSWYFGSDPNASWPVQDPKPSIAGWQWFNTHNEFGVSVDRGWYDDWFGGEVMDQELRNTFKKTTLVTAVVAMGITLTDAQLDSYWTFAGTPAQAGKLDDNFDNIQSVLAKIKAEHPPAPVPVPIIGPVSGTISGTIKLGS